MDYLNNKINEQFPGLVVRKDLVKEVKGNAIVPTYVLEFLLGNYCATSDEAGIRAGIETVKEILRAHYVHRNEANLIKSTIREKGRHRIIDKVSVKLNEKRDVYEATFANLGVSEVLVDVDTIKKHQKLLVGGVWCIIDLAYEYTDDKRIVPFILESLQPIQMSSFDFDQYLERRQAFTLDEWMDLLMQTIGFNPKKFTRRGKLLQLSRLVPYCERNYNLIELGPKGTGKSHIFSEFSPHGILISGGEVTVPKLFVNNSNGKIGLVGYWDCVAFDEFAGRKKRSNKSLVDILKNYMANKSFSRGNDTISAEASMVFVGNTRNELDFMLMHSNLFEELPYQFYDPAFLDRIHFYLPGWEVEIIRGEMFSNDYGFVVDYLAEILRHLRDYDYTQKYKEYFTLPKEISTRDKDGISKTFSGMMKVLFPNGEATQEEMKEVLQFSIEGRKRVKDQLVRIDTTFDYVTFGYHDSNGRLVRVRTQEEELYPAHYYQKPDLNGEQRVPASQYQEPPEITAEELIYQGEGPYVEFKASLSWNLEENRSDRLIQNSFLKTIVAFLNTEGGTLFVGVHDTGRILGIETDHFPTEDQYLLHFSDLVDSRIGTVVTKYISWDLVEVGGKKILRVDCQRSPKPVFLKERHDQELFFIRQGPRTKEIKKSSEIFDYCQDHFAE
jgi:ATP-dependent Lon protease